MPHSPILGSFRFPAFILLLNLTNQANGVTYTCNAGCPSSEETQLSSPAPALLSESVHEQYDHTWCSCVRDPPPADTNSSYFEWTSIRFGPYRRSLSIAQTWYCNDVESQGPVQFTASGETTDVPLSSEDCVERPTTESDWESINLPLGGILPLTDGFTCNGIPAFNINGAIISQHQMERDALHLPKPVRRSCTAGSLGLVDDPSALVRYSVKNFAVGYFDNDGSGYRNAVPGNGSTSDLNLDLSGGFTSSIRCSFGSAPREISDAGFVYRCFWEKIDSVLPGNVSAVWDVATHTMSIDVAWACNDKNHDTP
ncbi:hypothetical protein MMYC01_202680 [Madurella mycetomatis]|uniref:Uncharacterized protein n=1 Tax=Madurella mycetomatis TaxID=100816 RepID=A0A175WAN2_9PEZI|nr:hypothetical protein MMYC01_202680 [Madurella mycetomatis]